VKRWEQDWGLAWPTRRQAKRKPACIKHRNCPLALTIQPATTESQGKAHCKRKHSSPVNMEGSPCWRLINMARKRAQSTHAHKWQPTVFSSVGWLGIHGVERKASLTRDGKVGDAERVHLFLTLVSGGTLKSKIQECQDTRYKIQNTVRLLPSSKTWNSS
jgi:hypothetical protein